MPVSMLQARQLCSAEELALVLDATAAALARLSVKELRARITRARRLRDKFGGLAAQQRRETRGKAGPRGMRRSQGNERTQLKQRLFDETLARFEQQLTSMERGAPAVAPRVARKQARTRKKADKADRRAARRTSGRTVNAIDKASSRVTSAPAAAPAQSADEAPAVPAKGDAAGGKAAAQAPGDSSAPPPKKKNKQPAWLAGGTAGRLAAELAARSAALKDKSESTRGVRVQKTRNRRNLPKILAHVSSRGRKNQAKRDSK